MNKNIQKQIGYNNKQIEQLKKLQKQVQKGSEDWREYQEQIDSVNASNQDLTLSMIENAQAMASLAAEKANAKVEKLDSKDELTDAKIDNATTAKRKNNLIDYKLGRIDKRQGYYDDAYESSSKDLEKSGNKLLKTKKKKANTKANKTYNSVLKKVQKQVKAGKKIGQDLLNQVANVDENLWKTCVQYNSYYDAKVANKEIADLYAETSKQEKANLTMEKFNNVQSEYEYKRSANEQKKTSINNQIALAEANGENVSTAYYDGLIKAEKSNQSKLTKERETLQAILDAGIADGSIKKGSEEWYEMIAGIDATTNAIDETTIALQEYKNAQRQIRWDAFDESMESIKRLNAEADYYIERMSNDKLIDEDTGEFTDKGNATLALRNVNMKNYLSQAKEYMDEYNRILDSGDTSKEAIARMREMQDCYRDCQLAAEDELDAIKDLMSDGYNAQLDALSKLIDKYKDLRDSEKDAYDYQKQISEKTKEIANLQKQLQALGQNDTEEAKAKIQKLQVELQKSESDLEATEYERFISDTDDMLSDMLSEYEEYINGKLDTIDTDLQNILAALVSEDENGNTVSAMENVVSTLKTVDTDLSTLLTQILNKGTTTDKNANDEVDDGQKDVTAPIPTTNPTSQSTQPDKNQEAANIAIEKIKDIGKVTLNSEGKIETAKKVYENLTGNQKKLVSNYGTLEKAITVFDTLKKQLRYTENFIAAYAEPAKKEQSEFKAVNQAIYDLTNGKVLSVAKLKELAANLGLGEISAYGENSKLYKKLKELGIKGFASGGVISGLKGDKNLLLGADQERVLTPVQNELWEKWTGALPQLVDLSDQLTQWNVNTPDYSKFTPVNRSVGDFKVEVGDINMYGVNDPQEFSKNLRYAIAEDSKVQKCIQAVSVDLLSGRDIYNARKFK